MNIALIGTGLMGQALGQHLLTENQQLTVYNRTADKTRTLATAGAQVANSVAEAVSQAEYVLLMLSDAAAIEAVLEQIPAARLHGRMVIQMATIAPAESVALAGRLEQYGAEYLECPVLGSLPEAGSGTLIVMAGGDAEVYRKALPLLQFISKDPQYIGPVGQGAAMKLAMNQLIAGLTASFALSLGLIEKQGINPEQFMQILRTSALYAPTFDKKLERMLQRQFANPNFPTKHLAKDSRLFLQVAQQAGLNSAGLSGVEQLLETTLAMGLADTDYSALYAAVSPEAEQ